MVNNIDAQRDIILNPFIIIDGTNKSTLDGFNREWPKDTHCSKKVLENLQKICLINNKEKFIRKYGLLSYN